MEADSLIYGVVISDTDAERVRKLYSRIQSLDADANDAADFNDDRGMSDIDEQITDVKNEVLDACKVNFGAYFLTTNSDNKFYRGLASQAYYPMPVKTFVQKCMDAGIWYTELKPHKGRYIVLIPVRKEFEKVLLERLDYRVDEESVLETAQDAFWNVIAASYPLAKSGDFPPDATFAFDEACQTAARTWTDWNVPKE